MWSGHKSRQSRSRHRMSVLFQFIQWSDIQCGKRFVVPTWGAEICSDWISYSAWGREECKEINTDQHAGSHPDSLRHSCSHNLRCMWGTKTRMTGNGDSSCLRSAASLAVASAAYVPSLAWQIHSNKHMHMEDPRVPVCLQATALLTSQM